MTSAKHIPEEIIDEIRQRVDIVDVISEYVALKQAGSSYKGLCPFHKEKTPSFVVNQAKQFYHCYGCGAGGNVFTFLRQYEKYTFPETVRMLAKRAGIEIPTRPFRQKPTQELQHQDILYQLHREAAHYFSTQLAQHVQGEKAREYLKQRGINDDMANVFSLGYALPAWDALWRTFRPKYSQEVLLQSGLIIKKKSGTGYYDRFRDRLMIPIHDDRGRIAAFGGRILGEGEPKYLNSPETPIFHKGRTLFGMYHAKDAVRREESILIVEGYFDMIIPYCCGVKNIAATMGTALTEYHLRQLQRYTNKVILVFDADPAGMKAALRTLDLFLPSRFEVRSVVLPQGEDPDSTIRKEGVEKFHTYINNAPELLDFSRDWIIKHYDLSQVEHQIACANRLLPMLVKIPNTIARDRQINRTAELLQISDKALLQELKKITASGKTQVTPVIPKKRMAMPVLEQYLLKALLKDKSLISLVREELNPDQDLSSSITKYVVKELFVYRDQRDFEARILDKIEEREEQQELADLFMRAEEIVDPAKTVKDCLERLREQHFEHTTRDVTRKVRDAQEKKNGQVLDAFLKQKNKDLLRKKAHFSDENGKF